MTRDRTQHCCTCGERRRPTHAPMPSLNNGTPIVHVAEHRPMREGRWEDRPQLLVNVGIWRNGGTDPGNTHICDGCILVGLREAKRWVDETIAALGGVVAAAAPTERLAVYHQIAADLRATGERGSEIAALLVEQLADEIASRYPIATPPVPDVQSDRE